MRHQSRSAHAISSGPLSIRRCPGAPGGATSRSMMATTSSALQCRPTSVARASRVCSSTMLHSFSLLRSAVSSNWKSMAHTWFGRSARSSGPAARRPGALTPAGRRPAQPLVPPQSPRALAVDGVTLAAKDHVRRLPAPPRVLAGDLPQPAADLLLGVGSRAGLEPLGRAVLTGPPGRPDAARPRSDRRARPLLAGVAPGSEVSLGQLLEHGLVELGLGQQLLQPRVLRLQLAEALRPVGLHAAVLSTPAVPARLGHLELPEHLSEVPALVQQPVALAQLPHDLL